MLQDIVVPVYHVDIEGIAEALSNPVAYQLDQMEKHQAQLRVLTELGEEEQTEESSREVAGEDGAAQCITFLSL